MANMNTKRQSPTRQQVKNHEGATNFKLTSLEDLFSKVLGSFFGESTFYERRTAEGEYTKLVNIIESVEDRDKEYVLKIAELGRSDSFGKMIQYPLEILTACFNIDRYKGHNFQTQAGHNKLKFYSDSIVRRAMDVTSILATQLSTHDFSKINACEEPTLDTRRNRVVPIPAQMKKCLKYKIESFDKYKLSKGLSGNRAVTLADAIKLLRPNPADRDMAQFYHDIIGGQVNLGAGKAEIRTEMSKKGQSPMSDNADLKKAVYNGTMQSIIMALAQLYREGVFKDKEVLAFVCNKFRSKSEVHMSKLLPIRYYSAYKELSFANTPILMELRDAVSDALDISIDNVTTLGGRTAVLTDVSASMKRPISDKSSVTALEMASLLGVIAYKKGFGDLFAFGTAIERADMSREVPTLELVSTIVARSPYIGAGTDLYNALAGITTYAGKHNLKYDNLIILSDGDCYGYNQITNTLTFGERASYGFYGSAYASSVPSADKHLEVMFNAGIIKKVWINNLLGNDNAIVNTASHRKNLIPGYTEKFVDIIDVYEGIGGSKDIRKVIDELYARYCRKTAPPAPKKDRKPLGRR